MKSTAAANAAWCAVTSADPAALDREAVAGLLRSVAAVRAVCDATEVLAVRRTRELSAAGTSEPAEHLLANHTGRSSKNAREVAAREEACAAMPELEVGLAGGTVSAGHLDVAASAHAKLNDDVAEQFAAHAGDLVARSQQLGVDAFDRECRDLARHLTAMHDRNAEVDELERQKAASNVKRWVDRTTGMHNTLISLDPIRDAKMWKVISNQVGRERQQRKVDGEPALPFGALQAQAVVTAVTSTPTATEPAGRAPNATASGTQPSPTHDAATGPATTGQPSPPHATTTPAASSSSQHGASTGAPTPSDPPFNDGTELGRSRARATSAAAIRLPEISIHCDLTTMISGIRAAGGICETDDGVAVPPETVRRLACDAKIIPILLGSKGEVLDQGRQVRTATPAQRITLAAMHQSCAFPGCTIGFSDCRIHHIRWWWEHHGPTDIDNLLPLCEKHHHLVHEGGWGLILDPDRGATWSRPDGSLHHRGTTMNRRPQLFPLGR